VRAGWRPYVRRVLRPLKDRNLRRFFIAHGQSQLGSGAAYVALVLIAYQRLHSPWAISVVLLADYLPGILLSAVFGALADRCSRRTLALTAELLRAGAFIGLALVDSFAATVVLALAAGVGTALFRPAVRSALPDLFGEERRPKAMALYSILDNLGFTVGPAMCGLVLLFGPVTWVLAINGVSFLLSGLLLIGVPLGRSAATDAAADQDTATPAHGALRAGLRYTLRHPSIRVLVMMWGLLCLSAGVINVAEPLLATGPLHAGKAGFSLLACVYAAGMVGGGVLIGRLGTRVRTLRIAYLGGFVVYGLALLGSGAAGSLPVAVLTFAVSGVGNMLIVGPGNRLLQELIHPDMRGRVLGLADMTENTSLTAAFIAAGVIIAVAGPRVVYLISGGAMLTLGAVGLAALRPAAAPLAGAVPTPEAA
jgi:MFS family permease